VTGRVERAGSEGWRATSTLASEEGAVLGHRELQANEDSCRALDESLALAVALMIDPDALLAPDTDRPAEALTPLESPRPERPLPDAAQAPAPPAKMASARRWRVEAEAEATLAFGLVPGVGTGVSARLLLTPPSFWGVAVEGTFWRESDAQSSTFGSSIGLEQAGVSVCPLDLRRKRMSLVACAGL
jgi:hypothetical protein